MLENFPKFFTGIENREEHVRKLFYSGAYFAITFILLNYTSHAWSTSNAWDLGYMPLFNYDGMEPLHQGTTGWTANRIAWVYLAPPLWGLLISFAGLIAFRSVEGNRTHLKTFLFWLTLNGFLLYFSYLVYGLLSGQDYSSKLYTGFVAYYSWLLWGKSKIYGILTFQLIVSLPLVIFLSKGVLQLNYSRLVAAKSNGKTIIFIHVVLIPFVIGSVLVALATIPMDAGYQIIRFFCFIPVFLVLFLGMGFHKAKHITVVKGGLRAAPLFGAIILVAIIIFSRIGLNVLMKPFW